MKIERDDGGDGCSKKLENNIVNKVGGGRCCICPEREKKMRKKRGREREDRIRQLSSAK